MTQDEIIEMARQADVQIRIYCDDVGVPMLGLEAFAKLVASTATAKEREACAYRAGIALLGADRGLANRVDQAIRAGGEA